VANRLKRIFHYFPLVALFPQKSVAFWKYTNIGDRNRDSWVNDSHRETDRSRDTDADTDTDIDRDSLWNRHRHRHSQWQQQKQRRRDTTPSIHIVLFQYVTKCVGFFSYFYTDFCHKDGQQQHTLTIIDSEMPCFLCVTCTNHSWHTYTHKPPALISMSTCHDCS